MIPYSRQQITESDIQSVIRVLRSDFLTTGPSVRAFEDKLCELTGCTEAVACANGTAALHLACLALGLSNQDKGVTSPLTFLASANCIEYCGGQTDFVDIDPSRLCLSPTELDTYCQTHDIPSVVIPVSFAGVPADLPAFRRLADKFGFKLIEDAAHSLGSTYTEGETVYSSGSCAHTDMAVLSFHPVKTITTGEGGAVLTRNPELAKRLRLLRSHGMTKEIPEIKEAPWLYQMENPGFNYRITDLQCALGLSQLERLAEFKAARQTQAQTYHNLLKDVSGLDLPPWPKSTDPCFHLFPVCFKDGPTVRKKAYDTLLASGIQPQVHYFPVHLQPYYRRKYGFNPGKCPNAERFYQGCLSLPLFPGLQTADQENIASLLRKLV